MFFFAAVVPPDRNKLIIRAQVTPEHRHRVMNKDAVKHDSHDKCDKLESFDTLEEKIKIESETGAIFVNHLDDIQLQESFQNSTLTEDRIR